MDKYSDEKLPECPQCGGQDLWRHGVSRSGKRQWLCRPCKKVFVVDPYVDGTIRELAERMLAEEIPVPVIAKVMHGYVSRGWLYNRRRELRG